MPSRHTGPLKRSTSSSCLGAYQRRPLSSDVPLWKKRIGLQWRCRVMSRPLMSVAGSMFLVLLWASGTHRDTFQPTWGKPGHSQPQIISFCWSPCGKPIKSWASESGSHKRSDPFIWSLSWFLNDVHVDNYIAYWASVLSYSSLQLHETYLIYLDCSIGLARKREAASCWSKGHEFLRSRHRIHQSLPSRRIVKMTSTTSDSQELSGFLSEVHNSWSPVTFSCLATYYLCKWLQAIACHKNLLRSIHTWKILKVWRDRPLQAWCLLLGFILKRDTLCFWRAGFPSACSPQIMGASSWLQIPSNLFFNPVGSPRALSGSMSLGVSEFWTWPLHVCDSCVGFNPGQFQEHVWSQAPCNSLTLRRSLCQEPVFSPSYA